MTAVQRSAPASRFVRLGAVLAIVLGILGMHALSHHGTTHAEPTPRIASTLSDSLVDGAATGHAHHRSEATPDSTPATDIQAADSGDAGGPNHSLGDMLMLCVAMLAAAGTMLGLLAFIRRVPRLWAMLRPAATHVRPTSWLNPTGSGPPPVWQFSVIRC